LAAVCGLEGANSNYACIWCKCPSDDRCDMTVKWSISNPEQGARTTEEIAEKSKLPKNSKFHKGPHFFLYSHESSGH